MHRSETRELLACAACGATVEPRAGGLYAFGTDSALCFECAVERGGSYDSERERWREAPRTADLASEES